MFHYPVPRFQCSAQNIAIAQWIILLSEQRHVYSGDDSCHPENVSLWWCGSPRRHNSFFWSRLERLSFSLFLHLTPCSRRRGMQVSLQDTPESVRQASVQILTLPLPNWGVLGQLQDVLKWGGGRGEGLPIIGEMYIFKKNQEPKKKTKT